MRDRLFSKRTQHRLSRAMQVSLLALFAVAVWQDNIPDAIGSGLSLLLTFLPAVLEKDHSVSLDVRLTLWMTTAVFLHTAGSSLEIYQAVWWWDHLTHTLSATVVAAAGYTFVRVMDEHSDGLDFPPRFVFVFVFLATMAAGVVWEVMEFLLYGITDAFGSAPVLAQGGIEDTLLDLVFDAAGAVLVATWGTVYLTDMVQDLVSRLQQGAAERV